MHVRIRLNNIEESGYSINAHVRKITDGFIVNDRGSESHEKDLDKAITAFKKSAKSQKEEIKTTMKEQITKLQAGLDNIDASFKEAMAEAEKEIEQLTQREK